ncbi:MAG: helix-hairpin-helix domain-containing protein [Candidatus Promineifilaceae bacterium]
MIEIVMPKNYITLTAGLISLVFEKFGQAEKRAARRVESETKPMAEAAAQVVETATVATPKPSPKRDDLTLINGIGPTFARRLYDGGIDTFAKLAAAQPEEVKAVAKLAAWQADPATWIAAAKEML